MEIREATLSDVDQLADLFNQYRVWYKKDADLQGAIDFLTDRLRNDESVIFVVENDDENLVGFTQLYPIFSSTRMKRMWLLNDLFVHPDFRGQGISIMLIDAAKYLCQETGGCSILLETGKDNNIGNKLYPRTGFKINEETYFYEWTCD